MPERADSTFATRLRKVTGWGGAIFVMLGIASGMATFGILTGLTPIKPTREITTFLLALNGLLVLLMTVVIGGQLVSLLREWRAGTAGTGLHIRLVSLFSLIAIVPAILVALFASVTLNRGLDTWFSERTRAIVDSAVTVAEAYVRDHAEATRGDVAGISADLVQQKQLYDNDRASFVRRVARLAALRGLAAAFVFDESQRRIDVNVRASEKIEFHAPPADAMERANKGELIVIPPGQGGNVVRALIKLQGYPDHFLYVYRVINPSVIDQLAKTREAKLEYDRMLAQRTGVQVTFAVMYALVAFVFLLAAVWTGLSFSDRIVAPVVRLLDASRRVARGDFDAKVGTVEGPGDLMALTRTFNLMTNHIKEQRDELVSANDKLDERRRFTEAMLAGVSAGVIGVDPHGKISLVNRSAISLLGETEEGLLGRPVKDVLPEFSAMVDQVMARNSGFAEAHVERDHRTGMRNFFARITVENTQDAEHGYVLTFDDITELVSAQRNSAWADIARRIAHEIKNPLTPIQLSAERLKRKYGREIQTDKAVFEQCTDTIIRQVGDIGRMVDEFSSFARMPKALPEPQQLAEVVKEATILQRVSSGDVKIELDVASAEFVFAFDRRLITQAVTNLVKNAREAIDGRLNQDGKGPPGHILVEAGLQNDHPFIRVTDNGVGLPTQNRHRLAEPYMTTREKGTGLGLAIVKRVMEEHGGRLLLEDSPPDFSDGRGARITLEFARIPEPVAIPAE